MADIVTIEGDSMDDGSRKSLASGDKAIIDLGSQNYRQGGIFALFDGDTVIVKQVEYIRGTNPPQIICKSLNPAYDPFKIILDGNAHIIGRISGKIMRM
jgi:phage repressor protein C with HTH and peptisase S24 domain